ncbi:MAG: hypothetical protein VYA83_01075, partial [Candidatus Neomarinimicrobiota bacterium]|nr:hypothetical protein [Candidatus Neomarinimicrobiota bacterium]
TLDSSLYSAGAFSVSAFQYDYNKNFEGIFDEITVSSGMLFGEKFSKGWLTGRTQINFNKKNNIRVRGWVGDYFNKEDIPKHFRSYLSGGVDPTFSSYVFDRTGISDLSVMQLQYIRSGPALRGYATENEIPLSSSAMTWGLNIDTKIAFLPTLFYDIAGGDDFENTYSVAGIVLGPIILPLYQSWEKDEQTATDAKWITDRLRLQFSLSLDFSRGIRISL